MGQSVVLFINIVTGLYGALRFFAWLVVCSQAYTAEVQNSDMKRSEATISTAGMAKGCLLDFLIIAWWVTYFVALRR